MPGLELAAVRQGRYRCPLGRARAAVECGLGARRFSGAEGLRRRRESRGQSHLRRHWWAGGHQSLCD